MIDTKDLDRTKQFVGLEIGSSLIAKAIQKFTRKVIDLPENQIASHVFVLVYDKGWNLYESHLACKGVRKIKVSDYNKEQKDKSKKEIILYPHALSLPVLNYNLDFNPGYSTIDIFNRACNLKKRNDAGLLCSEYLALADFQICYLFNTPAQAITPAHWQKYFMILSNNLV